MLDSNPEMDEKPSLPSHFPQVKNIPNAATDISTVVVHPRKFVSLPLTCLPITFLLFETNMITTSNGGGRTPFITPRPNRTLTGRSLREIKQKPGQGQSLNVALKRAE